MSDADPPKTDDAGSQPGFWGRLDVPTKVISAIVLSAAAASAATLAIVGAVSGSSAGDVEAERAPEAVAARQIERCMKRHDLPAARVERERESGRDVSFQRCDWPPLPLTRADGFSEVTLTRRFLDKPNTADYNVVATLRSACERLVATVQVTHMGGRLFAEGRLRPKRVYLVRGRGRRTGIALVVEELGYVPTDVGDLGPAPGATHNEFYVLHTAHLTIDDAHCDSGT